MNREITVAAGVAPGRLDVYLAAELGLSRTAVTALIKAGHVTVDGVTAKASYEVVGNESLSVIIPAPAVAPLAPTPDLPIVYEDDDILVIDKPAGIVVHAGNAQAEAGTVADFARTRTTDTDPERPGIVHRLDKDTSGLLIIAKSTAAKTFMQGQWHDRAVNKTYHLLVNGRLDPDAAVIDLPLDRDPANPTRRAVSPGGRAAVTRYQTLASYDGYTFVEAHPETGRTHQLRVHFASVGHPVTGDVVYGVSARPLGLRRQFLHASALSFTAPSGVHLQLTSPLPAELQGVLDQLDRAAGGKA